jgi:hypothetical protein
MDDEVTCRCLAADSYAGSLRVALTGGHPNLSVMDLVFLAARIASVDGVALAEAHRQIDEFMRTDLSGAGTDALLCHARR